VKWRRRQSWAEQPEKPTNLCIIYPLLCITIQTNTFDIISPYPRYFQDEKFWENNKFTPMRASKRVRERWQFEEEAKFSFFTRLISILKINTRTLLPLWCVSKLRSLIFFQGKSLYAEAMRWNLSFNSRYCLTFSPFSLSHTLLIIISLSSCLSLSLSHSQQDTFNPI
jgi:hypothetical protein